MGKEYYIRRTTWIPAFLVVVSYQLCILIQYTNVVICHYLLFYLYSLSYELGYKSYKKKKIVSIGK